MTSPDLPIPITARIPRALHISPWIAWPIFGGALFATQLVIAVVTKPDHPFYASGACFAAAVALAGLAQTYAVSRLDALFRSLESALWADSTSAKNLIDIRAKTKWVFADGHTLAGGAGLALFVTVAIVVVDRHYHTDPAMRWFGVGMIELTAFLAGMAATRALRILPLFNDLASLNLAPNALAYDRTAVATFAQVGAEFSSIVAAAYILAIVSVLFSTIDIPREVTIAFFSAGGVVTTALYVVPQLQVAKLVRRNKVNVLAPLSKEIDTLYAELRVSLDSSILSRLDAVTKAASTISAARELTFEPGLLGLGVSTLVQVTVAVLSLR